MVEQMYKLV